MKGISLILLFGIICGLILVRLFQPLPEKHEKQIVEVARVSAPRLASPERTAPTATHVPAAKTSALQAEIERRFAGDVYKRSSALQTLKAFEGILALQSDPESAQQEVSREAACRALTFAALEGQEVGRWIEAEVFDTDEKLETYIDWNQKFNGHVLVSAPLERSKVCDTF